MADETETLPPRENPELHGHEGAEGILLRAFQSGRLPHGWLLSGPRGIGKATLAYRFARFLLSEQRDTGLFSEQPTSLHVSASDPNFRRVASGGHVDFKALERRLDDRGRLRSVIPVEDVRQALSFLRMTPGEAGWRVLIVDAADDLNANAANALLKVLEEPPEKALLLLISHVPGRLLPTIRSRCCLLALKPLGDDLMTSLLARHLPELDEADRRKLVQLSEGSIGRAVDLAHCGGLQQLEEVLGLLHGLPRIDVLKLQGLAERLGRGSDDMAFRTTLSLLGWWLARFLKTTQGAKPPDEIQAGEAALMEKLRTLHSTEEWLDVWRGLGTLTRRSLAVNLDRKQVTMAAFHLLEDPRSQVLAG